MWLDSILSGSSASLLPSVVRMTYLPRVPRFFFLFQLFPVASVPGSFCYPFLPQSSMVCCLMGFLTDTVRMHTYSHPRLKAFFMMLSSWSCGVHWLLFLHTSGFQWHEYIFVTVKHLTVATSSLYSGDGGGYDGRG